MNEEIIEEQESESADSSKKSPSTGVPYCVEDIFSCLETIDKIVDESGTATVITKEDISKSTGKKTNTLVLTFSTYQQYGIVEKVHGKGFLPSALYKKYREKIYDHHEREALLEMFRKPPLYAKIIEKLNGSHLPSQEKFPALLKDDPYNVNINSADRASKVFFENARGLKLITSNNKFVFPEIPIKEDGQKRENKPEDPKGSERVKRTGLVELPIHLPGEENKAVYFQYPQTLTKRDFKIIAKALTFVASSLIVDEQNEDYEITIKVEENNSKSLG